LLLQVTVLFVGVLSGCGERPVATAESNSKKKKKPATKPATKIDIPDNLYSSVPEALADVSRLVASNDPNAGHLLLKTETWIVRQGPSNVPLLAERVADENESLHIRITACRVLSKLGAPGRAAVTKATESSKKELRVKAIECLGRINPVEKASVDRLISLLDDKDNDIRRAAILGLTATKEHGRAAVPKLMATLNNVNEDETIRSLAKVALKSVDPRKGLMGADKERN
jgi:HEAT repeat protein